MLDSVGCGNITSVVSCLDSVAIFVTFSAKSSLIFSPRIRLLFAEKVTFIVL